MRINLSLRQLSVLHAIIHSGSAAAAAELLHITQPAVSKTVATMERELGYPLFHRTGRNLEPTARTIALMPQVERVLGEIDRLQNSANIIGREVTETLTITGNFTLISTIASEAAALFCAKYPRTSLKLFAVTAQEIIASIVNHTADIGLAYGPLHHSLLSIEEIGRWTSVCVMPKKHPLANAREIQPSDLAGEKLLTYTDTSPTGIAYRRLFENAGIDFHPTITTTNTPTILRLVSRGVGLGLVDTFEYYKNDYRNLVARPLRPRIESAPKLLMSNTLQHSDSCHELAGIIREISSFARKNGSGSISL